MYNPSSLRNVSPYLSDFDAILESHRSARQQQQSSTRCCVRIATPIVALVGGAVAYAGASGVNPQNYDQADTYHLNLQNGLIGAAGLVGGALVSWLVDKGVRACCALRDRAVEALPSRREDLAVPVEGAGLNPREVELEPEQQLTQDDFTTKQSAPTNKNPAGGV